MSSPQPGLLIFTEKYYSFLIINSDHARAGLPKREKSSASELLAVWGPFVAAAGGYEISGSTLATRPMVAKNPEVMAPGNVQLDRFELQGSTLKLTRIRNGDRPVANPTTLTFTRLE
ncbi:MAG TPA: lipocalin-like domain-containing protein [Bryobacteraceae bacterium]|nr:lipocalin-like domain-containing protein [Bryobacteraceae bacterium]